MLDCSVVLSLVRLFSLVAFFSHSPFPSTKRIDEMLLLARSGKMTHLQPSPEQWL